MKILILGGTGALGEALVNELSKKDEYKVLVTSRKRHSSFKNIIYVQGNAKSTEFLTELVNDTYDCIVDFMLYTCQEFEDRLKMLLDSTHQYIFVSSSRVFSNHDKVINENSPKHIDVEKNIDYLNSNEYSLIKAKQEESLKKSGYSNWVVIRPYKTYYYNRFQLGAYEKEQWLSRALNGKKIVIYSDYFNKLTSLTYAGDTAKILLKIIGNYQCNSNYYNIANPNSITWQEVYNIYKEWFKKFKNIKFKIVIREKQDKIIESYFKNKYRISKDVVYNRVFDDKKIKELIPGFEWTSPEIGLTTSLNEFYKNKIEIKKNYIIEGYFDRISNDNECIKDIFGLKNKIKYCFFRYMPKSFIKFILFFK